MKIIISQNTITMNRIKSHSLSAIAIVLFVFLAMASFPETETSCGYYDDVTTQPTYNVEIEVHDADPSLPLANARVLVEVSFRNMVPTGNGTQEDPKCIEESSHHYKEILTTDANGKITLSTPMMTFRAVQDHAGFSAELIHSDYSSFTAVATRSRLNGNWNQSQVELLILAHNKDNL